MRLSLVSAVLALLVSPAFAGSQGSAGQGGNGVTTSSSSSPEAKAGAKRSPTGGAPTKSGQAPMKNSK